MLTEKKRGPSFRERFSGFEKCENAGTTGRAFLERVLDPAGINDVHKASSLLKKKNISRKSQKNFLFFSKKSFFEFGARARV